MEEKKAGEQGVLSMTGPGRLVLANPNKFDATADVVVGVAAAVNRLASERSEFASLRSDEWARAFEFDKCFW